MVRAVADRAFLPTKNLLEQVGDMMILTGKTLMSALRPPYPYGTEFVGQFLFALRLCWFPLLISTVAFGYGAPGLQAGNFAVLFGAIDRLGGFFVLASIREFAPFVTAIILAGVAGTARTPHPGGRQTREGADALQGVGVGLGAEDHHVRGHHRHRLLLQGDDRLRRRRGRGSVGEPGRGDRLSGGLRLQLRLHPDAAGHPPRDLGDQVNPRLWVSSAGDIALFAGRAFREVFGGRVFKFFGEALRQAGILILGSAVVIWTLAFISGLTCGIEGAYFNRSLGNPAYAGVFAAWCDLREIMPYAFGYMMSAKVGTGLVAEIGAMRISDEIDALEVMGINSLVFLCATRLLAAWLVLPFMYIAAVGAGFFASYLAVVQQIGEVSSGGFFLIFWMFQNPPDLLFSVIKGMAMATVIVLVGCYYGYTAGGGPVGVGTATAKSMVLNTVMVHLVGMVGTQIFWGTNPRAPIGG